MKGVDVFAVVAGIVLIVGGLALLIASFYFWPTIIYAVIALVLGIVILLTLRSQEEIEQIKTVKKKGK